jgi:hypothetical protein
MLANAAYPLNRLYECLGIPGTSYYFWPNEKFQIIILQSGKDGMGRNSPATVQMGINEIIRLTLIRLIDA